MNKVILIGNLTADIELRTNDKGTTVAKPTVAINNGKDKDGNEIPADFLRFYVFNTKAENMAKYCKKGSKIAIEGTIKNRSWDKEDGTKGYETIVFARNIEYLDSKKRDGIPLPDEYPEPIQKVEEQDDDPFKDFGEEIADDFELPFD